MKFSLLPILFLLSWLNSHAQFAGYYTLTTREEPELHFILEEDGRFHVFQETFYVTGSWNAINNNKAILTFAPVAPVDFYAISDTSEPGSIYFYGFGDKKAWLHIDRSDRYPDAFMPVYKERPACSYQENVAIRVNRESLSKLTVAFHLSPDTAAGPQVPFDLYTYKIPDRYDVVYMSANGHGSATARELSLELKDGKYIIERKEELKRQKIDLHALPALVAEKTERTRTLDIARFKKEHYWWKKKELEKIMPEVSRKTITINDHVLFEPECPEPDPFPPVEMTVPK